MNTIFCYPSEESQGVLYYSCVATAQIGKKKRVLFIQKSTLAAAKFQCDHFLREHGIDYMDKTKLTVTIYGTDVNYLPTEDIYRGWPPL